ncbi:ATP-binding protein [Streptomyces sp. NPDC004647]|uniref:ATP-binding protein n=1 Tax=Streptomyces sp. NPDC004647 TaxID=3154671 RepID=UPI0033A8FB6F
MTPPTMSRRLDAVDPTPSASAADASIPRFSTSGRNSWQTRLGRLASLWSRDVTPLRPLGVPMGCPTHWDASWPLATESASVRKARRLAAAQLARWDLEGLTDTTQLLVSELVTNALRHARGPVRFNMCVRDDALRCEVEDVAPAEPLRREAGEDAEGGRGLQLLELLADGWGSCRTATGKTTWFTLRLTAPEDGV